MYTELLLQPVPQHLTQLVQAFETRLEGRDGR
jgi:hypothetical protein